ncbi:GTPase ObgE [Duncaniella muris]|uniref:GTPase ObgE n=2 Tax=Duncaniella TaxID=2518495 RepID=UPI0025B73CC0|nr:GTPase ObgE [Duncaniella muris]
MADSNFIDYVKVLCRSGKGGAGSRHFYRAKYVPKGGPDGGDGGRGGHIILRGNSHMWTLLPLRYRRHIFAGNGQSGSGGRSFGKDGEDVIVDVPCGTVVFDAETGEFLCEVTSDGEEVKLLRGGRGGLGNWHFKSATNRTPRYAQPGEPAIEKSIILELKLLADVGLVGFPNAGKSTLLSSISAARPKIADYPFTTMEPQLGIVSYRGDSSFVMADIPGLIEGAGDGVGLGHEFLRHVERCRLIVHVVDVSGIEGRDPKSDFEIINKELAKFNEELALRPQIVAANKSDMASEELIEAFRRYIEEKGIPFFCISAATTKGTTELVNKITEVLDTLPPIKEYEPDPVPQTELDEMAGAGKKFGVFVEDGIYYVEAPWIQPIMRTVDPDDYSSLQYFQRVLINSGIIAKLEEMGIQEGDTVDLEGFEFDFVY